MHTTVPVRVEDSIYKDKYQAKVALESGDFYIFDRYVVGEVHEGQHITWEQIKVLVDRVHEHFGSSDIEVDYISNRIHSYSVQPKDWLSFYKERHKLKSFSVVAYNKLGAMNIALERLFAKAPFHRFSSLDAAISQVLGDHSNTAQ